MKKICLVLWVCSLFPSTSSGQNDRLQIHVKVILIDDRLSQIPVPHITIVFTAHTTPEEPTEVKTGFDGVADVLLRPGKYKLTSPQGVDFQGRNYSWNVELNITGQVQSIELSNDNAWTTDLPTVQPTRKIDDLTVMFQKYQKSVVTVWSEIGSGTGFIVDRSGLVMTNQHVVGPSRTISIQFDATHKVAATLLAFDAERDVAVLLANLRAFQDAIPAPLATVDGSHEIAVEGERVFTIGSPLGLRKIITSGIVSKIEDRAIISDININHGNSGGPLFNSLGEVVGITTFMVPGGNGPGVSGIVRIDQTLPTLAQARKKMSDFSMPETRLLPTEPTDPYPLDSLKELIQSSKFDRKAYVFSMGGFDVALGTPVLKYQIEMAASLAAAKEKGKRTRKHEEAVPNTFEPLQELREWAEYVGAYKPVLLIQANPQLRETFVSALGRGMAAYGGGYGGPAHMKFKTDFYRMKLFCGSKEIEPIQPGKAATVANAHNAFLNVTDATYVGIYSYPPDAISPSCGTVRLQLYSEKEPDKPEAKDLDQKSIYRVWSDFQPYLLAHSSTRNPK